MKRIIFIFVVYILIGLIACLTGAQTGQKPIIAKTSFGRVKGERFVSVWTNQSFYAFQGIPYAKPPIGDLRFKDPAPPDEWSRVKDCTREQAVCPQIPGTEPLVMSEDCLYLSIYTPQLPSAGHKRLPVMVWIHGGGFQDGSGNYDDNAPDFLVAEGVVFVSINYRLGALGFLNLGSQETPGNVGLKDQRLALLWVQSEIHHFGGDHSQVTVFGWSAGSISAHLHYISPLSAGLFQKIIGDSGSPLAYRVRENSSQLHLELAKHLGCEAEDTTVVISCLKSVDFQDIIGAQALVKAPQDDKTGLGVFVPTIDKYTSRQPFLPDFPYALLQQKEDFFIPLLIGINSYEGIIRLFRSEEEIRNITNNLEFLNALQVPENCGCQKELKAKKLKQFYFRDTEPSQLNASGFVDVYTDILYAIATLKIAKMYQTRSVETFLYYFSFNGKFKEKSIENNAKKYNISGVSHREELNYLFVRKDVNQSTTDNSDEGKTWQRMVKMWSNFAKYGKPTVGPDPLLQNVHWQPVSGGKTNHLNIDVDLNMISEDLLPSRAALWDDITYHNCN